ncbi:hypothetical protein AEM38_07025 [Hyphomonadaceae bacterium UKL13-1]|nr:hypothetical protein AEM38_07025 [Hyphomonadaceae bacterium UKL13-1]
MPHWGCRPSPKHGSAETTARPPARWHARSIVGVGANGSRSNGRRDSRSKVRLDKKQARYSRQRACPPSLGSTFSQTAAVG